MTLNELAFDETTYRIQQSSPVPLKELNDFLLNNHFCAGLYVCIKNMCGGGAVPVTVISEAGIPS